jgi:hypothetical protein
MIHLNIKYSPEIDENRVKNTLAQLEWFNEKKYKVLLPENITESSNSDEIMVAVAKDYVENQKIYLSEKTFLLEKWPIYEKILTEKLQGCELEIQETYDIFLTAYGVGGSYNLPNMIIANIKRSWQTGLLRTVIHEIIHLSIEKYIWEYKIDHWTKERLVDLLLTEFFPDLSKMQNMSIPTEKIDKHFLSLYPDILTIIKKVSK